MSSYINYSSDFNYTEINKYIEIKGIFKTTENISIFNTTHYFDFIFRYHYFYVITRKCFSEKIA